MVGRQGQRNAGCVEGTTQLDLFRYRELIYSEKPVDFTMLKPRTRGFLKELFTEIFVNSQRPTPLVTSDLRNITFTRNRNAIEEIFIKASRIQALAMGLVYFLSETFIDKSEPEDGFIKFLRWAVNVAKDTLRTGVGLVPSI